jgi:carbon-monoxide dehydrogenase large subunit
MLSRTTTISGRVLGSLRSRSMMKVSTSIGRADLQSIIYPSLLSKARAIAAHLLQADASEVNFSAGRFTVGGSERGIDLLALAEAARDHTNLPDGMTPGLISRRRRSSRSEPTLRRPVKTLIG